MNQIFKQVLEQINGLKMNKETIEALNKFFLALNSQLKGDNTTLVILVPSDSNIKTNLLSDNMAIKSPKSFISDFKEYLINFNDNKELLFDIFLLLLEFDIISLSDSLRLILFKELFLSGYFSYVPLNKQDFKNNYDYIISDLKIIASIVSNDNIKAIDCDLNITLKELYLFDNIGLKDILI